MQTSTRRKPSSSSTPARGAMASTPQAGKSPSIKILRSHERGRTRLDWLASWHSFSFGDYYDPDWMGYGPLRVINDDIVSPSGGFPMHAHRDMEIVTVVLDGALEHRDSLGNGSVIRPGELQKMSAGSGIRHSEFNPSEDKPVRLLQIWIQPTALGLTPAYEQVSIPLENNQWTLLAGPTGSGAPVSLHQDARIWRVNLRAGEVALPQDMATQTRKLWLQVATGEARLSDNSLGEGDAAYWQHQGEAGLQPSISTLQRADCLLFDLPA